jgi:3-dehydroquinate synthase
METISLKEYSIQFDDSLESLGAYLSENKYSAVFILVDENTKEHCLPLLKSVITEFNLIETESGEENKNLQTCECIWQQLIEKNADRKAVVVNLGGGVIGDMGGFAAGCYKRGIDFVNVPTTLLSQVDSSIGGKLGIDFKYGKNLIGLFRNPMLVVVSAAFFKTLPKRQFINGWAEIFKHALIKDKEQWEVYKTTDISTCAMNPVVYASLLIKKSVVEEDPFERGLRKILNFGHTIGHAIETYSLEHDSDSLLHGEAIAIGMICEAYLSVQKCGLKENELKEIQTLLITHFPKRAIAGFDRDTLFKIMQSDKKNQGDKMLFALLNEIGSCVYDVEVTQTEIAVAIDYYIAS